jgi:hypothetical protein
VGFHGGNRIIAIIRLNRDEDGKRIPQLLYGKPPADFYQQWEQQMGPVENAWNHVEDQLHKIYKF